MRHVSILAPAVVALLAAALAGCGGATTETVDFANPDDGKGGAAPGDDAGVDAPGDDEADAGSDADPDTDSEGGVSLDSGTDGDSDANVDPPCAPPSDPTEAALCLIVEPETIAFDANDPKLDGNGILAVEVFNKANPTGADAPLDSRLTPAQPGQGYATKSLAELTAAPIRFESLPTKVYVRAFFVDDVEGAQPDALVPGTWIGGLDLSQGLRDDMPLDAVNLTAGKGTVVRLPLSALRKLTVTVSRTANPAQGGNAQGPLTVVAVASQTIDQNAQVFGLGELACANVSGTKKATVEGAVVGPGPYWVTGILDDFNKGGQMPAGGLVSMDFAGGIKIPAKNKLTYAADAYTASIGIDLNMAIPGNTGTDGVSCP